MENIYPNNNIFNHPQYSYINQPQYPYIYENPQLYKDLNSKKYDKKDVEYDNKTYNKVISPYKVYSYRGYEESEEYIKDHRAI